MKRTIFTLLTIMCLQIGAKTFAQDKQDWHLEKMPMDLETDFALSALPPHLRERASVYLLDPNKGYYAARTGTNGFSTFVSRTEWEFADFSQGNFVAISFDAAGSSSILQVYFDVAAMRATGKYSPTQIRDVVVKRVKDGTYKAPSRPGISYMLAPIMRTYPGKPPIVSFVAPHYMFYAPGMDNQDIGGLSGSSFPFIDFDEKVLDKQHSIFNYIILGAGEAETAKIVEDNKGLLERLGEYRAFLKVEGRAHRH